MRILNIGNHRVAISEAAELVEKHYKAENPKLSKMAWTGKRLSKADSTKKLLYAPLSMRKLLKLLDLEEYHFGCCEAIKDSTIMQVKVSDSKLKSWISSAEFPGNENLNSILAEAAKYHAACGNAFLLKMRNSKGDWVGIEQIIPHEIVIVEKYDQYGFLKPDYIQHKNNIRTLHSNADIIHIKRPTYRSNAWGLSSVPIAINAEILGEIKKFDFNNFKNGLLADYFILVEGGSLRDNTITDSEGNTLVKDAYEVIQDALKEATGNGKSHSSILIEVERENAKIRLEPLRQQDKDGGFINLKKDLREGVFAFHRVPARLVSQLVSGQLGGDNNSDMTMFYTFVVKPLQNRIATTLTKEINREFDWNLEADVFDFGNLTEAFQSEDMKIFQSTNRNK